MSVSFPIYLRIKAALGDGVSLGEMERLTLPMVSQHRAREEHKPWQHGAPLQETSLHSWATWRRKKAGEIYGFLSTCQVEAKTLLHTTH